LMFYRLPTAIKKLIGVALLKIYSTDFEQWLKSWNIILRLIIMKKKCWEIPKGWYKKG
jgi:hypothetical protein